MRTTFFKKSFLVLFTLIFTAMLSSCGGGSSDFNDIIDDVIDTSDRPGWKLNGLSFVASKASKNSLLGNDLLTSTSLGLNRDNEVVTSVVTLQYKDKGPGVYTLVSSIEQLFTSQTQNPEGKFLLIAASIINLSNDSREYQSDDGGLANVTFNAANDLVFNIPSPIDLISTSSDGFPDFPVKILFTLIDIFEDLPVPSLP